MTNQLQVLGTQTFMGIEIPVIEGGFGENCKAITTKTIAEIHNIEIKRINEIINNNLKRFKENVDIIDLLQDECFKDVVNDLGLRGSNRTKNVYILSERGYAKLIKIMDTDKAWEIHDILMDEYFSMRKELNEIAQKKSSLLLTVYDGGVNAVIATRQLVDMEVEIATTPLLEKIENDKPYTEFAKHVTESSDTVDVSEFSKIVKNEHIDIGRNRLFEWLRRNKFLMSNNTPYQKYIESKYFEVVETTKETAYGTKVFTKVLITGKGQVFFVEKLRKEFGVVA